MILRDADMAELADAIDLGSIPKGCRFDSCYPHQPKKSRKIFPRLFYANFSLFARIAEPETFRAHTYRCLSRIYCS